jgi:hypothetical protein
LLGDEEAAEGHQGGGEFRGIDVEDLIGVIRNRDGRNVQHRCRAGESKERKPEHLVLIRYEPVASRCCRVLLANVKAEDLLRRQTGLRYATGGLRRRIRPY